MVAALPGVDDNDDDDVVFLICLLPLMLCGSKPSRSIGSMVLLSMVIASTSRHLGK